MNVPHAGGRPMYLTTTCNLTGRLLYDLYISHDIEPVVVDADDYLTSQDYVRSICKKVSLDPALAVFSWPTVTEEQKDDLHPIFYASQKTLLESSGLNPAYAGKNRDLVKEETNWEAEFGEDLALVREMIELAAPHYRYLYERRMKM